MGRRNIVTVDLDGLARQWAHKPKHFIADELISNAADMPGTTSIVVTIKPLQGSRNYSIVVEDNHPTGVSDIDALTVMFVDSEKKDKAAVSGRFNIGEKLVLAFSKYFRLDSTSGGIEMDGEDFKRLRTKTAQGTRVECHVQMTREEAEAIIKHCEMIIPRTGQKVFINGCDLGTALPRSILAQVKAEKLPIPLARTMHADMEIVYRDAMVNIYEPKDGETPMLYELGIPVCPSEGKYHYDVQQKVPLPWDRDNVPAAYLRALHAVCLNALASTLSQEDMTTAWAKQATEDKRVEPEAVKEYMEKKHGKDAVRFDPSDPESARTAMAAGKPVIYGGSESSVTWEKATEAGATPKASVQFGTPKPYGDEGKPVTFYEDAELTSSMKDFRNFAFFLAKELMGVTVQIKFVRERNKDFRACYNKGMLGRSVHFFVGHPNMGKKWFENFVRQDVLNLLIHEFGHEYGGHLTEAFDDGMSGLGSKLTMLALSKPELFKKYMP